MKKFTAAVGRSTHKIMAKVGKAENTKDPEFEAKKEKCFTSGSTLKHIGEHTEKLMQLLQSNAVLLREIVDEFSQLNAGDSQAIAQLNASLTELEASRSKIEERLQTELCAPIKHYTQQYEILKLRYKELDTRRTDMDRFHAKLLRITEKTTGGKDGLAEAESQYRTAREGYEALHKEMLVDFERLEKDIGPFLVPAVAVFMREQASYAVAYSAALSKLGTYGGSVNTSVLAAYPHVITPPEASMAGAAGILKKKEKEKEKEQQSSATAMGASTSATATAATASAPTAAHTGMDHSKPLPTPGGGGAQRETAVGLYNFVAEDATEVSFNKGDVIEVISKEGEWWEGIVNGKRGLFPANYVKLQ